MKTLVRFLVGPALPWPTGCEEITSLRDALLWRLGSLPFLDAACDHGRVRLLRRR